MLSMMPRLAVLRSINVEHNTGQVLEHAVSYFVD